MGDIRDLETRLIVAFDRIGRGVETWDMQRASAAVASTVEDSSEVEQLRAALDEEKLANEQLSERVRTLKARSDGLAEDLSAAQSAAQAALKAAQAQTSPPGPSPDALAELSETTARQETALAQLRQASDVLRANNDALRQANAKGVGDADLINAALQAQVAQMAAERAADRAEIDGLLAALRPLLNEAAQTGEDDA